MSCPASLERPNPGVSSEGRCLVPEPGFSLPFPAQPRDASPGARRGEWATAHKAAHAGVMRALILSLLLLLAAAVDIAAAEERGWDRTRVPPREQRRARRSGAAFKNMLCLVTDCEKANASAHHATRGPVRRLRPVRYPPRRDRRVEDDHVRLLRRPRRLPGDRIRQSRAFTEPTSRFQKLQPRRKRRRRGLGSGRIVELRRRRRLRGARGHRQLRRRLRTRVVRRTTRLWVLASRASRTLSRRGVSLFLLSYGQLD